MESVSVIIPARNERFLDNTIREVFEKFKGSFEVIVTLDGTDANRIDKVKYIYNRKSKGMRTAINQAVALAGGKYIMKLDAHCMLDSGIDIKLIKEHQPNWVQIPRRKRLDAKNWKIDMTKADIDYMYNNKDLMGIRNRGKNLDQNLKKVLVDDTESFQGSCYFIERIYFDHLGLLDDANFSGSGHESQEITIKVLADGGRVIRNKKTWYAHARLGRFFVSDRSKSRKYIHVLAKKYGYKKG